MHGSAQQSLEEARKMESSLSLVKGEESLTLDVGLVDKHCAK